MTKYQDDKGNPITAAEFWAGKAKRDSDAAEQARTNLAMSEATGDDYDDAEYQVRVLESLAQQATDNDTTLNGATKEKADEKTKPARKSRAKP